jgi:hypothetical protein
MHSITPVENAFTSDRIGAIRHTYHEHPLMQMDALAALAHRLMPLGKCRFVKPGMKLDSTFEHRDSPYERPNLDEFFARIEEPGSWIALYDAQADQIYADFLAEVRVGIQQLVAPDQRIEDVRAFIFISAPPSVTPFHIDRENNFWLQIRGRKALTVFDHRDRSVVPATEVEHFILTGALDKVRLHPEYIEKGIRFDCGPGDGVYFPSTTPHMTESRPEWLGSDTLSISIGMVFYSNVTHRHARVHKLNRVLRAWGMTPNEPGNSLSLDRIKGFFGPVLWPIWRRFEKLIGRARPQS